MFELTLCEVIVFPLLGYIMRMAIVSDWGMLPLPYIVKPPVKPFFPNC